ncbi:aminoglycoside N(3)-acetyltransferase [Campylobacter sp. 2018MI35]|uniref:AAC(3) family N-acetyltransferase n=1 Tax=Campylobacter sp. 2018MI34 TaxID=2800582 RepID=UPI0019061FAE|nr:aminoglycoside N(3)-acetyltransferase [Campylobacter sp. 2018MI34]
MDTFLRADKNYTLNDLLITLEKLGIKKGDVLCIHTELFNFGFPLLSKKEYLDTYIKAFLEILGETGTLIMPTFTYSFCKNENYDKLNSKCKVGILNEFFRFYEGATRNNDPIFFFCYKRKEQKEFLKDHSSCFGENSVYDTLYKMNGKIILLGSEINGYTFTHFIEEKAKVPYRYFKNFSGKIIDELGNISQKNIKYYVRNLNTNSNLDVYKQIKILKNSNNFKKEKFGNSCIINIDSKSYLTNTLKKLLDDPYYLLKN